MVGAFAMARHARIEYPGALYHVTARGNDRRPIFQTRADREHLLELIGQALERYEVKLYAFVLMTTHYHLVCHTEHPNLSALMHWINTAYTVWTNKRNQRTGHLFEGRYKAIVMENEGYLLSVSAYVHLNPVRVRAWKHKPAEERLRRVVDYPWSSYAAYTKAGWRDAEPVISCERVWGELGAGTEGAGRRRYAEYVRGWLRKEEVEQKKPPGQRDESGSNPFSGMGLGCYVGGDQFRDFVQRLLAKDRQLSAELVGYRSWRKDVPMENLLERICTEVGIATASLRQRKRNNRDRDVAMYLCREVGERRLRDIAEAFGVKYAAVSLALKRVREAMADDRLLAAKVEKARTSLINYLKT